MNYISSLIWGSSDKSPPKSESELKAGAVHYLFSKADLEKLSSFEGNNARLFTKNFGSKSRNCDFNTASYSFAVVEGNQQSDSPDERAQVHVLVNNVDYDPAQGKDIKKLNFTEQQSHLNIPLSENVVALKYSDFDDDDEEVFGYVFYFIHQKSACILEVTPPKDQQQEADMTRVQLQMFEKHLQEVMLAVHQNKHFRDASKKELTSMIFATSAQAVMLATDVGSLVPGLEGQSPEKAAKEEETYDYDTYKAPSSAATKEEEKERASDAPATSFKSVTIEERLFHSEGDLHKYSAADDRHLPIVNDVFFSLDKTAPFTYNIHVTSKDGQSLYQSTQISEQTQVTASQHENLVIWVGDIDEQSPFLPVYAFIFKSKSALPAIRELYPRILVETKAKQPFKPSEEDMAWMQEGAIQAETEDVDMLEACEKLSDYEFDEEDFFDASQCFEPEAENRETIQAGLYDRTFVLGGPVVRVYKNEEDGNMSKQFTMPQMQDSHGDIIQPYNLMLHNNETQMLFLNEHSQDTVYSFDLNAGKIVSEFQANQGVDLSALTNDFKNAQMSGKDTFLAINQKGVFRLDPRVNKEARAVMEKYYKTNPDFQCMTTNLAGGFAIGSANGEIRMYKEVGQNAKTLLPGLGEPILALDVTQDGQWLLATSQTYLLVVPTLCENGKTGFEHRMGKEKPKPKKLAIKSTDRAKYKIKSVDFTPARFNNGRSVTETSIVTSTGEYVVTWNFQKVKRGVLSDYKIEKVADSAVDGQFRFETEEQVVVTTKNDVRVKNRHKK